MSPRALLMATRGSYNDPDAEAEPVLIEGDRATVTLTFDDGLEYTFDRTELLSNIEATAPAQSVAA